MLNLANTFLWDLRGSGETASGLLGFDLFNPFYSKEDELGLCLIWLRQNVHFIQPTSYVSVPAELLC